MGLEVAVGVTLIVSDLHAPYCHPNAMEFIREQAKEWKPSAVIFIGDEIDAYAFSQYAKDPDMDAGGAELTKAVKALKPLYRMFPKVSVCISNHTDRVYRLARAGGVPRRLLKDRREFLECPQGWSWRDHWDVDGVIYRHGEGFGGVTPAQKAATVLRRRAVVGHIHTAGQIWYGTTITGQVWGMSVGCLINFDSPAFDYGRAAAARPFLGLGVVAEGTPHLVRLKV